MATGRGKADPFRPKDLRTKGQPPAPVAALCTGRTFGQPDFRGGRVQALLRGARWCAVRRAQLRRRREIRHPVSVPAHELRSAPSRRSTARKSSAMNPNRRLRSCSGNVVLMDNYRVPRSIERRRAYIDAILRSPSRAIHPSGASGQALELQRPSRVRCGKTYRNRSCVKKFRR